MLQAIETHRLGLTEMRFKNKKNHLPEIIASNVHASGRFWMDHNKKKMSRMKWSYQPIGLIDGTTCTSPSNENKFSIENQVRFVQRSASAQRIEGIRN